MNARGLAAGAAVGLLTLVGCTAGNTGSNDPTDQLEAVSWWTSGSEERALTVLFDAYKAEHSGITVTNATVAGGGGSNAGVVLAQRLQSGTPPDVFQTFPGGALSAYSGQRQASDVTSVVTDSGLAANLPKVILDGLTVGGKQYGVPTSSHRGNVLFFNKEVLTKAGVNAPGVGYSSDQLLADLKTVDGAGVTALCLGAKDPFATTALFENVLYGVVGVDGYNRIRADRFNWGGDDAREALQRFGAMLDLADPQAAALRWDEATAKLAKGGCAYETLNDSAFGELLTAGAKEGTTFGQVAYPGTEGMYVAVVDTFVRASKAANGRNASDFLAVIAKPETQVAFSKAKGSVPVRTDADVSTLTPYQQAAAKSLRTDTVVWSITHGEAMSPQFQLGFYDAVATYVRSRDAKAFTNTLTEAMGRAAPPK